MASTILNANSPNSYGTVTISTTGSYFSTGSITVPSSYYVSGTSSNSWANITSTGSSPGISVTGDAEIAGKLTVGGKDISKTLEAIEKRLAILVPNPDKLEHFEALKKAYEHYKVLEALCELPKKEKE